MMPEKSPLSVAAVGAPSDDFGDTYDFAIALVVRKKEDFVALDRTANCAAKLVLVVRAALSTGKIIRSVKIGVAQKFEDISVKLVRPGLRDHIDLAAAIIAVFGVEVVRNNPKFADRIQVRNCARTREAGLLGQ